jgi:hypothetical protein
MLVGGLAVVEIKPEMFSRKLLLERKVGKTSSGRILLYMRFGTFHNHRFCS